MVDSVRRTEREHRCQASENCTGNSATLISTDHTHPTRHQEESDQISHVLFPPFLASRKSIQFAKSVERLCSPFWCQIQTLTSKCSKILIYSQNISFFPHPVSPICFNFHRCNSFKRKKSQLTVISLLTGLRLLFPFLRVFFQLCVVKHKKVIWEGTFRNPGITSFDQFVHDFEKMS